MKPITPRMPRRTAFTLLELLVVVAIIGVLAAISGAGYFYWVSNQQRRNTISEFQSLEKTFKAHWNFVVTEAGKETPSPAATAFAKASSNPSAPDSDPSGERARVLWIKLRLMEAFPLTYSEVNNNASNNDSVYTLLSTFIPNSQRKALSTYRGVLNKGALKAALKQETESAACLLMALSVNRGGNALNLDNMKPFIADTDGDGVSEIIDGWQTPITFYRFAWSGGPSNTPNVHDAYPGNKSTDSKTARLADSIDRNGTLLNVGWYNAPFPTPTSKAGIYFESNFHKIFYPATPAPVSTGSEQYVIPVFVSAGADTKHGLYPPPQCVITGLTVDPSAKSAANDLYAKDDLYSFTTN